MAGSGNVYDFVGVRKRLNPRILMFNASLMAVHGMVNALCGGGSNENNADAVDNVKRGDG